MARRPWSGGSRRRRPTCASATRDPRWRWSCGWRPRWAPDRAARRARPALRADEAVGLRLIQGGRGPERDPNLPGLLVEGAAEIVTMAGGLRMGAAQGDPAILGGTGE